MEEKPVTDLVLLPPLDLIPVESLPNKCSQELVVLDQKRALALSQVRASLVPACIASIGAAIFLLLTLRSLLSQPFMVSLFVTLFTVAFTTVAAFCVRGHAREVRKYRQLVPSPELQIDAENEAALLGMANITNRQIVTWNKRIQCALPDDIDDRYKLALGMEGAILENNIREIKRATKAIERDSFLPDTDDESETD